MLKHQENPYLSKTNKPKLLINPGSIHIVSNRLQNFSQISFSLIPFFRSSKNKKFAQQVFNKKYINSLQFCPQIHKCPLIYKHSTPLHNPMYQSKFTCLLQALTEEAKISIKSQGQSSNELSKLWNSKKNNIDSLSQKLAEIGISSPDDMNRFIQIWTSLKKLEKKLRFKINQNKKVSLQDLPILQQLLLDFLINKSQINDPQILTTLEEEFGIILASNETFLAKLNELIEVEDRKEFDNFCKKIIAMQFQDFQYLPEKDQSAVTDLLFKRNEASQILRPSLEHLGCEDLFGIISKVFGQDDGKQIENPEIETMEQFTDRIKDFFFSHCRMLKGRKVDDKVFAPRVQTAALKLFDQRQKKDLTQIKQILKQSSFAEFSRPQKIPDGLILQIFNLKSIQAFAQNQRIEEPKPVQKPSVSKISQPKQTKQSERLVFAMGKYKQDPYEKMQSQQDFGSDFEYENIKKSKLKKGKKCYSIQEDQLSEKKSESNMSQRSTNQKSLSSQNSQTIKQQFEADLNRIEAIEKQLKLIKKQTNDTVCFESVLRQLEISVLQDKLQNAQVNCETIIELINLYGESESLISLVKEIPATYLNKAQRKPLVRDLRRKIQHLNLEDIIISKRNIQSVALHCKDAIAMIEVGLSGVGKTTTLHGISGNKLQYCQKTKDYRCTDQKLAAQYRIGDTITSETTQCNNSKVPKKWTQTHGYQQVKAIDTPGLMDNRDAQTDIKNVLGTMKVIRNLKSAWILIFISNKQFTDKWYKGLKEIIFLISNYLVNIENFKRSMSFVLTKGLTKQVLLQQLEAFENSEAYSKENWPAKEKAFLQLFKSKIEDLEEEFVIKNPAKHKYQELVNLIVQKTPTSDPGKSISSSFSQESVFQIKTAAGHYARMIKKTFCQGKFKLTSFYLFKIKELDQIAQTQNHKTCVQELKSLLNEKVKNFEVLLDKFINYSVPSDLQQMMQIKDFVINPDTKQIFQTLYEKSQTTPTDCLELLIKDKLKEASKKFEQPSLIPKDQRKRALSHLTLIKQFKSQAQYERIVQSIQNQNIKTIKKVEDALKMKEFNQDTWEKAVTKLNNQFELDKVVINQLQNYQKIKSFVLKYFSQNPHQVSSIKTLLQDSKTKFLENELYNNVIKLFGKIKSLQETHFIIKQSLEPQSKEIIKELNQVLQFYEEQKQKSMAQLDTQLVDKWVMYQENQDEINNILSQFDQSQIHGFKSKKKEEFTIKTILKNLENYSYKLDKSIDELYKNPENIQPADVNELLNNIFALKKFITKRSQTVSTKSKEKDSKILCLMQDSIAKADDTIRKVINKIKKVANSTSIQNYELNYKLIVCLLVNKQFEHFVQEQNFMNEIKTIEKLIEQKLMSPLEEIKKVKFLYKYDFEKLCIVLKYLKMLDVKSLELGEKAEGFCFLIKFAENQEIQEVINCCFGKVMEEFKKFSPIIELSEFDANMRFEDDKITLRQLKQKSLKSLKYDLLNQAIQYIFSFNHVKKIVDSFSEIKIVKDFMQTHQENLNLKEIVIKRMEVIRDNIENPQFEQTIEKEELEKINREFDFLYGILEKTRDETDKVFFMETKKKIEALLAQYLSDFKSQYESAKLRYSEVHKGVQYAPLRQLTTHDGLVQGQNMTMMKKLLQAIHLQYQNHLVEITVALDDNQNITSKIYVFLNIYEFIDICEKMKYKYTLEDDLLDNGLKRLFKKILQMFTSTIEELKKGYKYDENLVNQYRTYEKRIMIYKVLKEKYIAFLKNNTYETSLEDWFEQQSKQIENNIFKKYITNFQLDKDLKGVYNNINEENKIKIREAAIQSQTRVIEQIKELIDKDYDKVKQQLKNRIQQLDYYPEEIKRVIKKQYDEISQKTSAFEKKVQTQIENSIKKKNPTNLLSEYINATNLNSSQTKKVIKNGMQTYIEEEKKAIDFESPETLAQNLERNMKFLEGEDFKKVSQTDEQIGQLKTQFIKSVKEGARSTNKAINHEFLNFKQTITQRNSSESFKLHEFKAVENNVSAKVVMIIQITNNYTILSEEHKQLIEIVERNIQEETGTLENEIKAIQAFKQKICLKEQIQKKDFINTIRTAHVSRQIYTTMKEFNNVGPVKVKVQQNLITSYDNTIEDLKGLLKQKYVDAEAWNFENSLLNDTTQMMIKRNKEISTDLKVVSNYTNIFFTNSQIPQNCLHQIQTKNKQQFQIFQDKTKNEIEQCFSSDQKYSCQRVRHYYDFIEIKKSTELLAFPSDMKVGQQIKNIIINKFKANTLKIENFITNQKKISQFNTMIQSLNNFAVEEKTIVQLKQTQIQTEKAAFLKQHEEELQIELKNIHDDQKKEEKKEAITKEFEGKKSSKLNDFSTLLESFKKLKFEEFSKKKNKITVEITQFVHDQMIANLIINRQARSYFSCEEEIREYPVQFETLLKKVQKSYTKKITKYIYNSLKQNQNQFSESIIDESNLFIEYRALVFQELAAGQTFDKLLEKIEEFKTNEDGKKNLLNRHDQYCKIYDGLLDLYKNSPDSYDDTLRKITDEAINMGNILKREYFDNKDTNIDRWKLLAYIFAIWTISRAILDDEGNVKFVHRPHPGQILAIFLLLNIDATNPSNQIQKCMVQVSTGEGKSVILGALSAYLALVGFNVYEACYSLYLSQRDYKDFQNLFNCLKIHDKISYNIFPEICKLMLDESPQSPFTKKIHDFVITPGFWTKIGNYFGKLLPDNKKKSSILLIDEADVFLDETYLGESYFPTICIKNEPFKLFLEKVWTLRYRSASLKPQDITQLKEFTDMCKQVNNKIFVQIMQNQTNAMIRDLNSYKNDNYTVQNGRIYYKEGDGLSDKIHYGYRTIWAYFHENSINKKVSVNDLASQLFNNLIVAGFSYSKLPFYFRTILGVTGTLESMSNGQKQILRDQFGVQKMYVQPSIYPPSNRVISFKKCYNGKIYEEIVKSIEEQHNKKRPVIVFFNSKDETYDFFESKEFSKFKTIAPIVTYEVKPNERDFRIEFSTEQGKITLLTYDFSRGTDFKLKVKDPKTHPGLHVICSFLPTSYSDYIQLAGRTGRQGKNGSVFIIIGSEKQLKEEETVITREQAEKDIRKIDTSRWAIKLKEVKEKIKRANDQHQKSMKLYSSGSTVDQIFQNIKELNHEPPIMSYNSKTAICIDATGSMGSVLPKVKQVVQGAIPDIYKAIEQEKVQGSFQLKIVIYRNYSSGAQLLLQTTNFETKSEPLVNWLSGIKVNGGQGNEAIEVCFQHINNLEEIHQCVIIGDAQANTYAETVSNRSCNNENYWNNNGFPLTNFDAEVQKLIQKNIKVHSYYLNPVGTANFYKKLSTDTSGVSEEFKINDKEATKNFADFVANKIISSLGEMVGGDAKERMLKRYMEVSKKKKYV